MGLFGSRDEADEAISKQRIRRFRSKLIVYYFLAYFLILMWWMLGGWVHAVPAFDWLPFGAFFVAGIGWLWLAIILVPCLLLLHLFSLAVMGVLYQLRMKLWIIYLVTPILGVLLTWGFLMLCSYIRY